MMNIYGDGVYCVFIIFLNCLFLFQIKWFSINLKFLKFEMKKAQFFNKNIK